MRKIATILALVLLSLSPAQASERTTTADEYAACLAGQTVVEMPHQGYDIDKAYPVVLERCMPLAEKVVSEDGWESIADSLVDGLRKMYAPDCPAMELGL